MIFQNLKNTKLITLKCSSLHGAMLFLPSYSLSHAATAACAMGLMIVTPFERAAA
jgi:hypothetical protein